MKERTGQDLFDRLLLEYGQVRSYRELKIEPRWKDSVSLVCPKFGEYGEDPFWEDKRFDATATECVSLVGDAMYGNICSASLNWFRYEFTDESLNEDKTGKKKLEQLTKHMVDVFRRSTYYDVAAEYLGTCVGMGAASLDIQEDKAESRIICRVDHPRSLYLVTNSANRVESVYQRAWLTIEQAVDKWTEKKLDPALIRDYSQAPSSAVYEFVNVIKRRVTGESASREALKMPYASYWLQPADPRRLIIDESGYRTFPKPTWRWSTRGNDPYGWGPTDDNMPDIRTLNSMAEAYMSAGQRAADPAKFYPEEGRDWSNAPGATNYMRDPNRRPFYFESGSGFRFNDKMFDQLRERVRQGYKTNHFLMLRGDLRGDKTAREVLEIKKEQAAVTGSPTGKAETEGMDAIHQRFLQIELDSGRLEHIFPAGTPIPSMRVTYLGPLSQLQRELQAQEGILGGLESAVPVMQMFPQTANMIKRPELVVEKILRSKQFPEDAIASEQEYAKKLQEIAARAEQAQKDMIAQEAAKRVDPNAKPQQGSPAEAILRGDRMSDNVKLALISAYSGPTGELALDATLELLHHYDDVSLDLSPAEMAAQVALQNAARALLRRMGIWAVAGEARKLITHSYLQLSV